MVSASAQLDSGISSVLGCRLDRRVVLKAAAVVSALAMTGEITRQAMAQDPAEIRASTWHADAEISAASVDEYRTFQADFDFNAIAPHWAGWDGDGITIELRLSPDGALWTDPIIVGPAHVDGGPPDRDGRRFGCLTFVDSASFVRFRVLDAGGYPTQVADLDFTYIDASNGPSLDDIALQSLAGIGGARPPIISRAEWGANENYRFDDDGDLRWPPEYQAVEHVIIHHTDTPNSTNPLAAVRSIYYYHAVERGWGDIGYNYLVDHQGNIYEGRAGGESVIGGHAYQYARGSSGIGTIGNFAFESESVEAQAALVAITAWVGRGLDPYGWRDFHGTADVPTICGHRDVDFSDCPGDVLYSHLPAIRDLVAEVQRVASTSPDGALAPGQVVRVLVPDGNLRSGPSTGRDIIRTLDEGTVMTVLDGPTSNDGYDWYEVADIEGSGWCASFLFQVAPADQLPQNNVLDPGDSVYVATDALNLRSGAGTGFSILATLPNGATGTVDAGPSSSEGYLWYRLQTQFGTGWTVGMFLGREAGSGQPASGSFAAGDVVRVATDFLNVRSGAGLGTSVRTVLSTGAIATVLSGPRSADGYEWYELSTDDGDGWAVAQYLARVSGGTTNSEVFLVGHNVEVATDVLNLRSQPSTNGSIVASMPAGTRLVVTEDSVSADGYTWYGLRSVQYGDGWSVARYLSRVELEEGQSVRVIDGALNMRSEPGTGSSVVAVLPDRTRLTVVGGPVSAGGYDWYQVRNGDYGTGWCAARYLQAI